MNKIINYFKSLSGRILIGVILGIIVGVVFGEKAGHTKILGDIFLNLMNMCVPFLIFGSVVMSVSTFDLKEFRSIGGRTLLLFLITTAAASFFSVAVGVALPYTIDQTIAQQDIAMVAVNKMGVSEVILNFFPKNIFVSFSTPFILQIIVFALFYGISINLLMESTPQVKTLLDATLAFRSVVMKIISLVMYYAPVGIFGIIASTVGTKGADSIKSLGLVLLYITLVNIAFFILYTLYMSLRYRLSLAMLLTKSARLIVFAATTTSTALSLTVAMEDTKYLGVKEKISNFILPLGSSLNTNGGPITNVIVAIATVHLFQIDVDTTFYIMLGLYATIAAFGNPGVIGGALVSMIVVFDLVGLPHEAAMLFFGLDAFYAVTRVVLNIMGSVYCCIMMAHSRGEFDRETFNTSLDNLMLRRSEAST
ncbi:MAG: dicarboxylate/amino acid:cation symporter [Enterobacteriaceae bacterium]